MAVIAPVAAHDFDHLDALLARWQWLWQPAPFTGEPAWQSQYPGLAQALIHLDDHDYLQLVHDDQRALQWLGTHLPALAELAPFVDGPTGATPWQASRKQGQVEAFAAQARPAGDTVVEWCAGQGWLLERLARQWPERHCRGLEWQPRLCEQGNERLRRAGLQATLAVTNVLSDPLTLGRRDSVVALHACGHLHQALLQRISANPVHDLHLSPCCYHLGSPVALSQRATGARLAASAIDRHLAVQDIGVGHGNRQRRAERSSRWRLGYDLLQRTVSGHDHYRPTPSWPAAVWQGLFADFCHHCAAHHGLTLPADTDFDHWRQAGAQRHREVRRLELPRRQFRRLLEWWLVLDMAWYLAEHGYRTRVLVFCPAPLTPRNLLLVAERD